MSHRIKTSSKAARAAGQAGRAPASVGENEVRPLDELVSPVEVAESIPEEVEGLGEVIRQSAQLTLGQAQASFARMRQAAEEATANVEASVAAAGSGVAELNLKAFEAAKSSADVTIEFVRALAGARTLSDVLSLQAEHMRTQFETMNTQAKEFAELASKVSARAMAPLNDTFGKTFAVPA